ncbi:MAG: SufBD protein [Candidatus Woesebacteria bacterium GW2011_GWA1_39_8]|jgi:Fe-S cluster assembly protein SufD|uniref:SufBD protein n=1 Tax=Candidatus Woesebacteria bacterium GW2011_GWA1_39_8 TaxID=1618552 RepID=A0A0G0PNF5_9BACT|nr:MAG: SufBD protein [Candidatus Woesebacteria bacterium GW2011_GWA1_39_8]
MSKNIVVKADQKRVVPVIWTGNESEIEYDIKLAGRGAEVTLLMLLFGDGNKNLATNINVLHDAPDTKSRVVVKGALNDASHVDFEGLVKIEPGAKHANAWLAAHLLLLSEQAGGRAVPKLEITENDVKAGHASTVGKVNDMELFYLMSRGLSKEASTGLIVQGFLESLLSEFPIKDAVSARKKLKWL